MKKIQHILEDNCEQPPDYDNLSFRVDHIRHVLAYCADIINIPSEVDQLLHKAFEILESFEDDKDGGYVAPTVRTGQRGRPAYYITKDQLHFFVSSGFNVPQMASLLNVGKRTIERRLHDFSISLTTAFSLISNDDLDEIVRGIVNEFPNVGNRRLQGFLRAKGIDIEQHRVRETLRRVDPEGVLLRAIELNVIKRQPYHVMSPLSLWHIDRYHGPLSSVLLLKKNIHLLFS